MTENERELGLQLGDAHTEIRELKEERDNALRASRYETDLCQQALADLRPYRADAERYRWLRDINAFRLNDFGVWCFYAGMNLRGQNLDTAIDAAIEQQRTTP